LAAGHFPDPNPLGSLQRSPDSLAELRELTSKRRRMGGGIEGEER